MKDQLLYFAPIVEAFVLMWLNRLDLGKGFEAMLLFHLTYTIKSCYYALHATCRSVYPKFTIIESVLTELYCKWPTELVSCDRVFVVIDFFIMGFYCIYNRYKFFVLALQWRNFRFTRHYSRSKWKSMCTL